MPFRRRRPVARMAVGTAVVAGTAHAVGRRSANNQNAADQQAAAAQQAAAPAPAEDPYEQLKQLGALHEQGILTDEEFAAQKAKLLA
jgi:membrane protease subunit (stomatin/prohibitin family)